MKKNIIGIELFCGCGGLTKGLGDAGISMIKGIDIDETAKITYEKNNPKAKFVKGDIKKISVKDLMKGVNRRGKYLLLAGCAPCQPFSIHNSNSQNDKRRSLIQHFANLIKTIRPEFILVENVPGFKKNNVYYTKFINILKKHHYYFDESIIDAAEYGVPQHRKRYVLVGSLQGEINLPKGKYGKEGREYKTVRDAIKKFPKLESGKTHKKIRNHSSRNLSDINLKRIRLTPKNGGSRCDVPEQLKLQCHKKHKGHSDVYGRMCWDKPAPTLTCKCTSISNGRFGHPVQNRAISVREAATLQTFPKNYVFYSTHTNNTQHIGNAVPVLLAKQLGKSLMNSI